MPGLQKERSCQDLGSTGLPLAAMTIGGAPSNSVTLFRSVRSTAWKRWLIALVAVPAVLVGLLAMHALAAAHEATSHSESSLVSPSGVALIVDSVPAADAAECGEVCGPAYDMGAMACLLALLLCALAVAMTPGLGGWNISDPTRALLAKALSLTPPAAPSLERLSISRT